MSYAERVSSSRRPACWGSTSYNPDDPECAGCRNQHSCRAQNDQRRSSPVYINRGSSSSRPYRSDRYDRDDYLSSDYDENLVGEHETPFERFMKDAVAGAFRGLFREMYEFWRRYRIR